MASEKDRSHIAWLQAELPGWVNDGVVDGGTAERLRERYAKLEPSVSAAQRWALVLFGIIGAVLVGGGIILLLAHNWDDMTRPMRAIVAFAPLVISQALCFWILWTNNQSIAWREAAGTLAALMVGACIALISQTYNLGGDFPMFMLTWTLLSLPMAYLLRATLPAVWFCSATVIWGFSFKWHKQEEVLWFWPLLLLVVPLWWLEARHDRFQVRSVIIGWATIIAGCFGVGITASTRFWKDEQWILAYGGWYAFLFLAGRLLFGEGAGLWRRPMQVIGLLGACGVALFLTFEWPRWIFDKGDTLPALWRGLSEHPVAWISTFGWGILTLGLWVERILRKDIAAAVVGVLPLLILVGEVMATKSASASPLLFNVYLFAAGVAVLALGVRKHQLGTVNGGLAIISALVLCRFFDSDMSFILRGLGFIALGIGFFVTNLIIIRRKGSSS